MDVADVLSRLAKCKQTAPGKWLACCPAHRDKTPSLTIREMDDGRILIHDFGGCEPSAVMEALGLELADLFPQPLYHRARPVPHPFTALDALRALRREAAVVAMAVSDAASGVELTAEDRERLVLAAERIASAAEFVHANS